MVEIGQFVSVDLSCIIVIHLVSCIIHCFICFFSILIYLAVSDALKTACFFKSRTESAYSCKDIKIFYQYELSPFRFFQQKTVKLFFKTWPSHWYIHFFIFCWLTIFTYDMEIVHTRDNSERSVVIKDAMHSADIIHMFDIFLLCRVRIPFWWKLAKSIYGFTPEIFTLKTQKKLVNTSFSRCASISLH